jgi:hypothetical protein
MARLRSRGVVVLAGRMLLNCKVSDQRADLQFPAPTLCLTARPICSSAVASGQEVSE